MASHHAVNEKIEEENHNVNRAAPGVGAIQSTQMSFGTNKTRYRISHQPKYHLQAQPSILSLMENPFLNYLSH
jgi:hypothetical protein